MGVSASAPPVARLCEPQAAVLVQSAADALAGAEGSGQPRLDAQLAEAVVGLLADPSSLVLTAKSYGSGLAPDLALRAPLDTTRFDLALALLTGAHAALDQLPGTSKPYEALLEVAAQYGLARSAMQVLALMQDNDRLTSGITPRVLSAILRALFGDSLLDPARLRLHRPPPPLETSTEADQIQDYFSLLKPLFKHHWDRWRPSDTPDELDTPQASPAYVAAAVLDGCFLCNDPDGATALFAQIDSAPPLAVQVILAGIYNTQGATAMVEWFRRYALSQPKQSAHGLPTLVDWVSGQCTVSSAALATSILSDIVGRVDAYIRTSSSVPQARTGAHMWLGLTQPSVLSCLPDEQVGTLLASVPQLLTHLPPTFDLSVNLAERLVSLAGHCRHTSQLADGAALITWAYRWVDRAVDPPCRNTAVPSALLGRVALLPEEVEDEELVDEPLSVRQRLLTALAGLIVDTSESFCLEEPASSHDGVPSKPQHDSQSLVTLIQSLGPLLAESPYLLEGLRREKWNAHIVSLFRSATLDKRETGPLLHMAPQDWTHVLDSLAWEEDNLEPDWDRMMSSGLGWAIEQVDQWLIRHGQRDGVPAGDHKVLQFLRPTSFAAFDTLLSRYEERALPLLAQMNPRLAHLIEVRPWEVDTPLPPALPIDTADDVTLAPDDQIIGARHAALTAQAGAEAAVYPSLQEIDEDLSYTLSHRLAATAPVPDALLDEVERAVTKALKVGTYPSPGLVAALVTVAGVQERPALVRRMYAVGLHLLRALPAGQAAQGWTELENGMVSACVFTQRPSDAQTHRAVLLAAGQVPSADAYGALISASRSDRAQATDLYGEFLRLGGPGTAYLFTQVLQHVDVAPERILDAMLATGVPPHTHWAALAAAVLARGPDGRRTTHKDLQSGTHEAAQRLIRLAARAHAPRTTLTPAFNVLLARAVSARDGGAETVVLSAMRAQEVPFDSGTQDLLDQM